MFARIAFERVGGTQQFDSMPHTADILTGGTELAFGLAYLPATLNPLDERLLAHKDEYHTEDQQHKHVLIEYVLAHEVQETIVIHSQSGI